MTEEEYNNYYFNKVENMTAVCRVNSSWLDGERPELEIGKTYKVSHIGVLRSNTIIRLVDFGNKVYSAGSFDIYENGEFIDRTFTEDPRFWAPYLRKKYREGDPDIFADDIETIAIPAHLRAVEHENNVKVLLAVESGSRAWGFESENSDWDVRFIYVHKPEWYFSVNEQRDVIEHFYEDDVDLAGWELKKALTLLKRCNSTLLEWLHSPKVYYIDEDFARRIREVDMYYFNPIKTMYHYNHIYNKYNERYVQKESCNMKHFLYYLRGILACKWIEKMNSLPPVVFKELLDATVDDKEIKSKIEELIRIKKSGEEHDMHIVDQSLMEYARNWADHYNETIDSFRPELSQASTDALDSILYDMVKANAINTQQ